MVQSTDEAAGIAILTWIILNLLLPEATMFVANAILFGVLIGLPVTCYVLLKAFLLLRDLWIWSDPYSPPNGTK